MRLHSLPCRLCAIAAAGSLTLAPIWPDAAWAQAAPPPPAAGQSAAAGLNQVPPTRAGRLAQINGTVSFHAAEDTQWSPAVLNYPVTTGNSFWTEPQAQAALELSGNRFMMMSSTELDVTQLDDHAFAATLPQGEVCMALSFVPGGDTYAFQTPRGLVQIAATGNIAVVAGDTQNPTTVLVQNGAAQITGTNLSLQVGAGQMASISGADSFQGSVGAAPGPDPCLQQLLAPPPPVQTQATGPAPAPAAPSVAPPPVVQEMTGYQDLQQYGSWQQSSSYGAVWYPQVASSWVPYREGRWAYVAPWGWTWVDSDPWGFAPFHYGRWIYAGNRWGWAPVEPGIAYSEPPVYAPALVSFFGIGAAVAAGAAVGAAIGYAFSGGNVGWVPLGWHEPYYPWYRVNNGYLGRVNRYNVTNLNQVINNYHNVTYIKNVQVNKYVNIQRAATVVPARAMVELAAGAGGGCARAARRAGSGAAGRGTSADPPGGADDRRGPARRPAASAASGTAGRPGTPGGTWSESGGAAAARRAAAAAACRRNAARPTRGSRSWKARRAGKHTAGRAPAATRPAAHPGRGPARHAGAAHARTGATRHPASAASATGGCPAGQSGSHPETGRAECRSTPRRAGFAHTCGNPARHAAGREPAAGDGPAGRCTGASDRAGASGTGGGAPGRTGAAPGSGAASGRAGACGTGGGTAGGTRAAPGPGTASGAGGSAPGCTGAAPRPGPSTTSGAGASGCTGAAPRPGPSTASGAGGGASGCARAAPGPSTASGPGSGAATRCRAGSGAASATAAGAA